MRARLSLCSREFTVIHPWHLSFICHLIITYLFICRYLSSVCPSFSSSLSELELPAWWGMQPREQCAGLRDSVPWSGSLHTRPPSSRAPGVPSCERGRHPLTAASVHYGTRWRGAGGVCEAGPTQPCCCLCPLPGGSREEPLRTRQPFPGFRRPARQADLRPQLMGFTAWEVPALPKPASARRRLWTQSGKDVRSLHTQFQTKFRATACFSVAF